MDKVEYKNKKIDFEESSNPKGVNRVSTSLLHDFRITQKYFAFS